MLALLVALTVSQAPTPPPPPIDHGPNRLAVVVSRRTGLTVGRGLELADAVAQALEANGLAVTLRASDAAAALARAAVPDTAGCEGEPGCLSRLAGRLQVRVVVGVGLAQVVDDVAVRLLAVPSGSGLRLADSTFILEAGPGGLTRQVAPFARQLTAALETLPLAQPQPAARLTLPSPGVPSQAPAALAPSPSSPSRVPLYLAGGGALAFAGAGVGFLAVGLHQKGRLEDSQRLLPNGTVTSSLTQAEARSLRDVANRDLAIGVTSVALSAGLVMLTTYLWARR
jgi:hypothetical protein